MRGLGFNLGCASAAALLGCAPATTDQAPDGEHVAYELADKLSSSEIAAYIANQQYIDKLATPGKAVQLNLADPRQHEFVMARLKLAGKHAENSPYLFEMLEQRRKAHIARGFAAGTFARSDRAALNEDTSLRSQAHYIESSSVVTTEAGVMLEGAAGSTFPGVPWATGLDVSVATSTGFPLAPLKYTEVTNDPQVTLPASGRTTLSNVKRYRVSSYKWEDSEENGFVDSYVFAEVGAPTTQPTAAPPRLRGLNVVAPMDQVPAGGDGKITICVSRPWTTDCDHVLDGPYWRVRLPMVGSIGIETTHTFDTDTIDAMTEALRDEKDVGRDAGSMMLVLATVGGACTVAPGTAFELNMYSFWKTVRISADKRTMSWNMSNNDDAVFHESCQMVDDKIILTARIPVPMILNTERSTASFTISNDETTLRPDKRLEPMSITNSCLAEGTQVRLPNGKIAKIESLEIGQEVYNPYDRSDQALTIMDTAKGTESTPMVRLRDEAGRTLLTTELHPIATADRGMVQARTLRAGDVVMTVDGPSELAAVTREPYSGRVYNLKLGAKAELANLGTDQTVLYANGFVVGDGQIQSKYEKLVRQQERDALPIPAQWRRDFEMSPYRK